MCSFGGGSRSRGSNSSSSGGGSPRGSTMSAPRNTAAQDLKMDLGLTPKNDVYYRDLNERTERSRAMMESMTSGSDNDNNRQPAAAASAPEPAPTPAPTPTPTPPPVPTPEAPAGAEETKVVEGAKTRKGRASTVKTEMQGLLTAAKTRRRRSLLAGQGEGSSGLIS